MNPTNESIGRAFLESIGDRIGLREQSIINRARELDRKAPGEWVMVPREMTTGMRAAFFESKHPNERWEELLSAAPQPPAQEQGEQVWRYRFRDSETGGWHGWRYSESEPALTAITIGKTEVQGPFTRAAGAKDARGHDNEPECITCVWGECELHTDEEK